MNKKIGLAEAEKLATPVELSAQHDAHAGTVWIRDQRGMIFSLFPDDEKGKMYAALLVHKWNRFDEVVEALNDAVRAAESGMYHMGDAEQKTTMRKSLTPLKAVLQRAREVEMP